MNEIKDKELNNEVSEKQPLTKEELALAKFSSSAYAQGFSTGRKSGYLCGFLLATVLFSGIASIFKK